MDLIKRILIACFILCLISCKESKVNNIKLEYPYLINSDIKASTESIFFTDTNYVIRSINVNNYKLNWEFNLEKRIDFLKIKFVDKYLFIGGNTENQYSYWLIERSDGSLIARHTFNYNIYHAPLFIENDLYFINSEFQVIKCNIFDDLCNVISIEGTAFGVPNNLVSYKNKLYTSLKGNLVEIDINTFLVSNITSLNIEFQGVIDYNRVVKENIIIPCDNELIIFDLDNNKLQSRYSATDSINNIQDYFCGFSFNENFLLTKSMAGLVKIYEFANSNYSLIFQTDEAPFTCENSIKIIGNFILNSNYSNIELIDINTKEKRKIIREKKISPFVQNGNIVLYINSENELCKIDLTEI